MKISAFLDMLSPTIEEQFEYAKKMKLGYISLRSVNGKKLYQLGDYDIETVNNLQRDYKIKVIELDASIEPYDCYDDLAHNEAIAKVIKVSNVANKIGVLNIVITLPTFRHLSVPDHNQVIKRIKDYSKVTDKAKRRLLLIRSEEEMGGSFTIIANGAKSKYVGVIFSPEATYKSKDSITTSYRVLKSQICALRVSDFVGKNPQLLGYGEAEILELFKRVKQDGIDEYLTLDVDFGKLVADINKITVPQEKKGIKKFFGGFVNNEKKSKEYLLFKKRLMVDESDEISHFQIIENQIQVLNKLFR